MEKQVVMEKEFEKEFVPYDLALRLKALGFKERVLTYYEDGKAKLHTDIKGWDFNNSFLTCVSRPTYAEIFEWFQKFRLFANVYYVPASGWKNGIAPEDWKPCFNWVIKKPVGLTYSPKVSNLILNQQEANKACLENLIEICSSK
jgi:hypothetical protein